MHEKMTRGDIEKLQAEIDERRLKLQPELIAAVQEARAQGDLSENFEYYAAKREKRQNESRIRYLENMIKTAVIIEDHSKADEVGLLACCNAHDWSLTFYSAEQLMAVPGSFTKSDFVKNTVGVDNVCERAAAADGGRIIVPKTALNGVTVAVAELKWGIEF